MRIRSTSVLVLLCLAVISTGSAQAAVISFDDLADSTAVGATYAGATFTGATVLTAGLSLNEFEFPPLSGSNVVFDDGQPIRVDFASLVTGAGGYFTYLAPVTLSAYGAAGELLGSASSSFLTNLALSGDAGSAPHEFIGLAVGGIAYVMITGDPAGSSFTLDNLTYQPAPTAVPEPGSTMLLLLLGLAGIGARTPRRRS